MWKLSVPLVRITLKNRLFGCFGQSGLESSMNLCCYQLYSCFFMSSSCSFRITRTAEDLAHTITELSQRLIKLEKRLETLELNLNQSSKDQPANEIEMLDGVDQLIKECNSLLQSPSTTNIGIANTQEKDEWPEEEEITAA